MPWIICLIVGIVTGAGLTFFVMFPWYEKAKKLWSDAEAAQAKLKIERDQLQSRAEGLKKSQEAGEAELAARRQMLADEAKSGLAELAAHRQLLADETKAAEAKVQAWANRLSEHWEAKQAELKAKEQAFSAHVISYDEITAENGLLKRDLQNIDVSLNKSRLDHEALARRQQRLDDRANDLAKRYLKDTTKWAFSSLNVNNYPTVKSRIVDAYDRCRGIGFTIPGSEETEALDSLQAEYQRIVKASIEREEQSRIKAQIREEARLQREAEEELLRAARERALIEKALAEALAKSQDQHSAEVDLLRAQLAEAEAKSQRALSMAQQTKAGNVYVISNIGAFGHGMFKVGMTRRLEPKDRIKELGDASVPFPFDIHMMISCDDAPALESALHKKLHRSRVNRVNPRKEFFRSDIETIVKIVQEHRGDVQYVADPEALEYNQSLNMSDQDAEFIEAVYEHAEAETGLTADGE